MTSYILYFLTFVFEMWILLVFCMSCFNRFIISLFVSGILICQCICNMLHSSSKLDLASLEWPSPAESLSGWLSQAKLLFRKTKGVRPLSGEGGNMSKRQAYDAEGRAESIKEAAASVLHWLFSQFADYFWINLYSTFYCTWRRLRRRAFSSSSDYMHCKMLSV